MVSALDSGWHGPGSIPVGKTLNSQCLSPPRSMPMGTSEPLGQPKKMLGWGPGIELASHPGGVAIFLVGFIQRKPG